MKNRTAAPITVTVWTLLAATVLALPVGALPHGDCDGGGQTEINEVQRCAIIFTGAMALAACPQCDSDGSGSVAINEVQGVANCFLDATSTGCRMITPASTPTSTDTPSPSPPATATPPPTSTPPATSTATVTLAPTNTAMAQLTETPTSTPVATFTATATRGMAACGNGVVEEGETCDDGNTVNGDLCPSDCTIIVCPPAQTMTAVAVSFSSPVDLAVIRVFITYPDGTVEIPGAEDDSRVQASVTNRPSGTTNVFDFGYSLQYTVTRTSKIPSTQIAVVHFNDCTDAPPPVADDFSCSVLLASNTQFMPQAGVTCSVELQ